MSYSNNKTLATLASRMLTLSEPVRSPLVFHDCAFQRPHLCSTFVSPKEKNSFNKPLSAKGVGKHILVHSAKVKCKNLSSFSDSYQHNAFDQL